MIELNFNDHSVTDNVTQKMANLLLKGWTMLSETCNKCSEVPLMRSKEGTSFCCKCSNSTDPKIPIKKTESVSDPNLNGFSMDPYRTFGEIQLNGQELNGIHNGNYKVVPGPTQPIDNSLKESDNFHIKQLYLLEVQINKRLSRYIELLSSENDQNYYDLDRDYKIIKNIEGFLGVLSTLKNLI